MKRFLKNILIFSIALLGLLVVEDAATTYAFHKKTTRKYVVWNDIVHDNINADLIILGNSRAWCQYSPQILDSVLGTNSYNIGIDGSCFNRQLARYELYRYYIPNAPKYVIQNVEFFTLGHTVGYEREQFMPYLIYPYFREQICQIEPFSFGELYIPMYRYYVNNVYDEFTTYDFPVKKGYFGKDNKWDGSKLKETEPCIQEIDSNSLKMLIDYIEGLHEENIKLILVFAPIYKEGLSKVLNVEEIHGLYYDLASKYNLSILDYANCWLSQDTTYFYNATHLNKQGAELFSTKLAHDLDSLGFIR